MYRMSRTIADKNWLDLAIERTGDICNAGLEEI
jgi:hypothetical protein